jgi:carbon monoxide dehydrogenase subunit G
LTIEGKGKPGFVNGTGHIQLFPREAGETLMKYTGDVQIGGRLASVGQRLIDTASKSIISQGLDTMNQALQARVAAQTRKQLNSPSIRNPVCSLGQPKI